MPENVCGWETAHRDDKHRMSRKYFQLLVDEITFAISGLLALIIFWWRMPEMPWYALFFVGVGATLLLVLAWWIWVYADLAKGRGTKE